MQRNGNYRKSGIKFYTGHLYLLLKPYQRYAFAQKQKKARTTKMKDYKKIIYLLFYILQNVRHIYLYQIASDIYMDILAYA